jgi:hypothetical protein
LLLGETCVAVRRLVDWRLLVLRRWIGLGTAFDVGRVMKIWSVVLRDIILEYA